MNIQHLAWRLTSIASFGLSCWGTAACGGPRGSGGCHYEAWQGQCKLMSVRTARVVERFPQSFVVIEALYEPQSTTGAFAPPPFRKETMALADNEQALSDHLRMHADVACSVQNPIGDPCAPSMQAAVPEFLPQAASQASAGPVGCAKIEQSGGMPVPASVVLPGPFQFNEGSAAITPEVQRLADEAVRAITSDPRIECVAVKAKTAPGEDFALANDRAQALRRLLEARGIEHSRLTVFEATAPTRSANPEDEQPVASEMRRGFLSVVVYAAK